MSYFNYIRNLLFFSLILFFVTGNLFGKSDRERRQFVIKPSEARALINDRQSLLPDDMIQQFRSPDNTRIHLYKSTNEQIGYLFQLWFGSNWVDYERDLMKLDGQDRIVEDIYQLWGDTEWMNLDRFVYEYSSGNMFSSIISQKWEDEDWKNLDRDLFTYDVQSRITEIIHESWVTDWIPFSRMVITYTGDGKPDIIFEYIHYLGGWEIEERTRYEYDVNGNNSGMFFEFFDGEEWKDNMRILYEYDENNNMINQVWEYYVSTEDEWVPVNIYMYAYNAQGELIETVSGMQVGEELLLLTMIQYEYNLQGLREHDIYYLASVNEWILQRRTTYTYDNNHNLIIELNEDAVGTDWINSSRYLYGVGLPTNIAYTPRIPYQYELIQNYPNPFNPSTTIRWQIPEANDVTLKVFDILGREVATLVDEYRTVGRYDTEFDASHLPSGTYIYRLQAGGYVEGKKLILLK